MKDKVEAMKKELTENKPRAGLFVATPMYGGVCTGTYAVGVMNLGPILQSNRISMYFSYITNESLITRARNNLANNFLKTDCTHLMFIDADIGFDPHDVVKMIDADVDLLCGIYPKKTINWPDVYTAVENKIPVDQIHKYTGNFVINLLDGKTNATGDAFTPMEVLNGGTGFMLIKRGVFEKLAETTPSYACDTGTSSGEVETVKEFFTTCIEKESNQLLSEDYYFCKIAREAGFKVYAAPWPVLTHTGTYTFSGSIRK